MYYKYFSVNYLNSKLYFRRCYHLKKTTVTSLYCPLKTSRISLLKYVENSKTFQSFLQTPKLYKYISSKRYISVSSQNFNTKEEQNKTNDPNSPSPPSRKIYILIAALMIFFSFLGLTSLHYIVTWEEFVKEVLSKGEVEKIIVNKNSKNVYVQLHKGAVIRKKRVPSGTTLIIYPIENIDTFEKKLRDAERELGIPPTEGIIIEYQDPTVKGVIGSIALAVILSLIFYKFQSKMKIFPDITMSKANFTLVDSLTGQGKGVKFSDVAGLKEAKIEVMEFVDYLKRPEHYRILGAKIPKGALLLGPPGCGKTLLAKAVASESNVPFLSMNGTEFVELIGGLGASRVRDLFKEAKKRIPCIIYIDEIDAIGKTRTDSGVRGNPEEDHTLNQLLVEMDGLVSNEGIVILASTNRADVLDSALLRPGRFDRQILISLPTFEERVQIFEQHLKSIHLENEPKYYSKRMAHLTPGFSGADIANVCNEAALHAAKLKKEIVQGSDLEYAVERVLGGAQKQSSSVWPEEKKMLAYYEAGRALVGWISQYGYALLKITIVPRTETPSGWTQFSQAEKFLYTKEELLGKMHMGLGGQAAVSLIFNKITTAGEKHLKQVTKLAYAQIKRYGMSENIGLLSFDPNKDNGNPNKPYSKHLRAMLDEEARKLVASAYKEAEQIILDNKDKLILLAEELLKRETLDYNDVEQLIGPPPHKDKKMADVINFESSLSNAAGLDTESHNEPEPKPSNKAKEENDE